MKTTRIALLALLLLGAAAGATHADVRTSVGVSVHSSNVDFGFFYDDLAPYGRWIDRPSYGWVWTPTVVDVGWRPYEDGHWVWTDQGWLWVTDEPFGWATYHYGRWYDDPDLGWAWVPGYEWAPSWVSWQEDPDYIGWAPLPPSVHLTSGFNGSRLSLAIGPSAYVFVPERHFLAPSVATYVVAEPLPIFRRSRNVTHYRFSRGRVFCEGVSLDRVGRFHRGGRVPRFRLADVDSGFRRRGARFRGDQVEVFRPQVRRARVTSPALRPAARRSVVSVSEFRESRLRRTGRAAFQARQERSVTHLRGKPDRERVIRESRIRTSERTRVVRESRVKPDRARVVREARPSRIKASDRTRVVRESRPSRVKPPDRGRVVRESRPSRERTERVRVVREPRPSRSKVTVQRRAERPVRITHERRVVREQRVRPEPRIRHAPTSQRLRSAPSASRIRQESRSSSVRQQRFRSEPQRMRARPEPRQQREARQPQRQRESQRRHRPPR